MTVVYTALFGESEELWSLPPVAYEEGVRYICFTDTADASVGLWTHSAEFDKPVIATGTEDLLAPPVSQWEIQPTNITLGSARKQARYCKANPHRLFPQEELSIWVDANVRLLIKPSEAISMWLKGHSELAAFKHPDRNCLFDEGRACIRFGKDTKERITAQLAHYTHVGMPRRYGLASTRCLIRRNTTRVRTFNEAWWVELNSRSLRDQVSFPYICWKLGMPWAVIPRHAGEPWYPSSSKHFWFTIHGLTVKNEPGYILSGQSRI